MIEITDTIPQGEQQSWQPATPITERQSTASSWRPAKAKQQHFLVPYRPESVPDSVWNLHQAKLQADSVRMDEAPRKGFVLVKPQEGRQAAKRMSGDEAYTWILLGMGMLFVALCLLLRANSHYLQSLRRKLFEVRERNNMFDDTVRETTLTVLLNVLCAGCVGICLYCAACWSEHLAGSTVAAGACIAISSAYCALMPAAYWILGNIFYDRQRTSAWLSGFTASQGVLGLCLFPLVLLLLFYHEATEPLLISAGVLVLTLKFLFIWKGFRIFYRKNGLSLLFLYYLCGVEAVPLLIMCAGALQMFRILT